MPSLRSALAVACLTCTVSLVSVPAAAQGAAAKIEAARLQLEARNFDSATVLLRQVIEQDAAARLEAYVWLGLVNHFAGRDSLARAAFRQAFTLDRDLRVDGIAELDPKLPQLLAEERAAARGEPVPAAPAAAPAALPPAAIPPPAGAAAVAGAADLPAARCLPGCTGLERAPEFVSMPRVAFPDHLESAARSLDLVVRAVVDTAGRVEPKSVEVIRSNVVSMNAEIMSALGRARFRPGRAGGVPMRTLVELTFRARSQGAFLVLGAPERL
jgi:hypothetical protein